MTTVDVNANFQVDDNGTVRTLKIDDLHVRSAIAKGYQQLSVTTGTAVALTVPAGSKFAVIQTSGEVRWRDDGTNPTATVGMKLAAAGELDYDAALAAIKFIA